MLDVLVTQEYLSAFIESYVGSGTLGFLCPMPNFEPVRARTAIVHFSEPVAAATARLVKARNGLTVDQPI
jgi:hypothetical protein